MFAFKPFQAWHAQAAVANDPLAAEVPQRFPFDHVIAAFGRFLFVDPD
jgi:hypothetical protein